MKPRVRAYSLDHYRWHYNQSEFNVDYYNGDMYQTYILVLANPDFALLQLIISKANNND